MFNVDLYDFATRSYDPTIGKFLTMNPLAEKYYSISPYAYCNNNPVKYTDPTGKWIVGTDGKPVTYTSKNGFSENASKDVQRIGREMIKTETGFTQFAKLVNHEASINISISENVEKEGESYILGHLTPTEAYADENGEVVAVKLDMVINEGSLKEYIESKGVKASNALVNEVIGTTAVHESGHTEPENLKQTYENQKKGTNHDLEKIPNELTNKHIEEIKNKRK